jgi:hypothetical protein
MDNPEKLATLDTYDTERGQIPSGIKKKSTNRGIDQVIVLKM